MGSTTRRRGLSCSAIQSSRPVMTPLRGPPSSMALWSWAFMPPGVEQPLLVRRHAPLVVGLAELLGDGVRPVVEVATAIGPQHVVQDHHRQRRPGVAGHLREGPELVVDGVPVVVPVDQRGVHRGQGGQHVQAEIAVEDVAAPEAALVLGRIEIGSRVDDVQLGTRPQPVEHLHRVLAPQRADLDHPAAFAGIEHWRDGQLPERKHSPDYPSIGTPWNLGRYQDGAWASAGSGPSGRT